MICANSLDNKIRRPVCISGAQQTLSFCTFIALSSCLHWSDCIMQMHVYAGVCWHWCVDFWLFSDVRRLLSEIHEKDEVQDSEVCCRLQVAGAGWRLQHSRRNVNTHGPHPRRHWSSSTSLTWSQAKCPSVLAVSPKLHHEEGADCVRRPQRAVGHRAQEADRQEGTQETQQDVHKGEESFHCRVSISRTLELLKRENSEPVEDWLASNQEARSCVFRSSINNYGCCHVFESWVSRVQVLDEFFMTVFYVFFLMTALLQRLRAASHHSD